MDREVTSTRYRYLLRHEVDGSDQSNLLKGRTGRATARALTSSLKLPSLNDFLMGAGLQHSTADFKNADVTVNMLILKVRHARWFLLDLLTSAFSFFY